VEEIKYLYANTIIFDISKFCYKANLILIQNTKLYDKEWINQMKEKEENKDESIQRRLLLIKWKRDDNSLGFVILKRQLGFVSL
jgi:hypothetical protein